jgi:hypothetical protein
LSATAIDVLALMAGNPTVAVPPSHLAIAGSGGMPIYQWLNGPSAFFAEIKNALGWPADGYTFDANWLYSIFTEVDDNATDYNNPKTYRQMQSSSTPNGGFVCMPRWYVPGSPEVLMVTPDSSYVEYLNGVAQPKQTLGGPVVYGFSGPWNDVDFGGNLGLLPYYLQRYLYNPGLVSQEQNCYVPGYGRVRWQDGTFINSVYTVTQTSLFNTSVTGPCPKLTWVPA